MIASLNIVAKTFAKITKTFTGLSATIIATRRRPVLISHLEAKYAKIDCKNEIYAKNWVRSIWTSKSQPWKKSTIKVNGQSKSTVNYRSTGTGQQMTSQDDVALTSADEWMLTQLGLTWH